MACSVRSKVDDRNLSCFPDAQCCAAEMVEEFHSQQLRLLARHHLPTYLCTKPCPKYAHSVCLKRLVALLSRAAIVPKVLKAMKNPRSALQKTSLMALADMFHAFADKMLDFLDALVSF
jgi:hypothetical protein